jgi:hypothetical protein
MLRIALIFGSLAGIAVILPTLTAMTFSGSEHLFGSETFGYLVMLIALSLILVGIKRYRDEALGGVIRFPRALLLGLMISVVAAVVYVAAWELYLYRTDYAFIEEYVAEVIEARQQAGLAEPVLAAEIAELEALEANYSKPLFRLFITFTEIFPVGLLVSLVAAALLRFPGFLPRRRIATA